MEDEYNIDQFARPGSTAYMEAPALRRGLYMPLSTKLMIAGIGVFALLVAAAFGFRTYTEIVNAPTRFAESIETALNSGPGLELPTLSSFAFADNETIRSSMASAGYSIIDVDRLYASEDELDENSIDYVKVPIDIDYETAVSMFRTSLRRTPVQDAAHFLAGTWRFTSYSSSGTDLKVKYADFNSATIEEAITRAIEAQGWADSTFGESGVDQSGNTFQSGTIDIEDRTLHWTVSACPLDEVYSVNGLPENSFYVGSRLFQ